MREIKDKLKKSRDTHCLWNRTVGTIKSVLAKLTYRYNSIPIKIRADVSANFCCENWNKFINKSIIYEMPSNKTCEDIFK